MAVVYDVDNEPSAEGMARNYREVMGAIAAAVAARGGGEVQLVAVSKTKSPACLQRLYDCGHRVFGENYVHELIAKAAVLPRDIQWRFIGHLQRNKARELLRAVPGLAVVESVDSEQLAAKLEAACVAYRADGPALEVFVQVNTSGEASKSGVAPGEAAVALARYIREACPHLRLAGLMTIGMPDYSSRPENFSCLVQCREEVTRGVGLADTDGALALSMGMSGDYQSAIAMGATSVRVGTALFGARFYPPR